MDHVDNALKHLSLALAALDKVGDPTTIRGRDVVENAFNHILALRGQRSYNCKPLADAINSWR